MDGETEDGPRKLQAASRPLMSRASAGRCLIVQSGDVRRCLADTAKCRPLLSAGMTGVAQAPSTEPDDPLTRVRAAMDEASQRLMMLTATSIESTAASIFDGLATAAEEARSTGRWEIATMLVDAIGYLLAARVDEARATVVDAQSRLIGAGWGTPASPD